MAPGEAAAAQVSFRPFAGLRDAPVRAPVSWSCAKVRRSPTSGSHSISATSPGPPVRRQQALCGGRRETRRGRRGGRDPARLRRRLPAQRRAALARCRRPGGADDAAGAIATFTGTVRRRSRDRDVRYLEYEAYEGMAEEMMAELAGELSARHELSRDRDPSSRRARRDRRAECRDRRVPPHRAAALAACQEAIDTLKGRCRSGRRRSTRAARNGSARGHSQEGVREYPESMSYDPYAPREAEEPQGSSPIKHPLTCGTSGGSSGRRSPPSASCSGS